MLPQEWGKTRGEEKADGRGEGGRRRGKQEVGGAKQEAERRRRLRPIQLERSCSPSEVCVFVGEASREGAWSVCGV